MILKLLINHNADINSKTNDGVNGLMYECLMLKEDIIIELLKNNAKIDELDNNSDDVYAYLKSNECGNTDEVNNIKKILKNYK